MNIRLAPCLKPWEKIFNIQTEKDCTLVDPLQELYLYTSKELKSLGEHEGDFLTLLTFS